MPIPVPRQAQVASWLVVLAALTAPAAAAQSVDRAFGALGGPLAPGDTVFVTGRSTGEVGGRLVRLTPGALVLDVDGAERAFTPAEIGWVERYPDPFWDRAVEGLVAGYVGTMLTGAVLVCPLVDTSPSGCLDFLTEPYTQRLALRQAALFGVLGLLGDAVSLNRHLVYGTRPAEARSLLRAPEPAPTLDGVWRLVLPGDRVRIRARGQTFSGEFVRASADAIAVVVRGQEVVVPAGDVHRVERRTHRLLQGMAYGATAGVLFGVARPGLNTRQGAAIVGGIRGLGFGMLIGAAWPRGVAVYDAVGDASRVRVQPTFSAGRAGLALSIAF